MRPGTPGPLWPLPWGALAWAVGFVGSVGSGDPVPGGVCWLQQGREATCSLVLKTDVSQAECCASGSIDTAWSNFTHPGNKISLLGFLGLVHCLPCKGKLRLECSICPSDLQATELGASIQDLVWSYAEIRARAWSAARERCAACWGAARAASVRRNARSSPRACRSAARTAPPTVTSVSCAPRAAAVTWICASCTRAAVAATCFLGRSIGVRHAGSCTGIREPSDAESEEEEENFV
ncbi:follistatin-related protein 3 isoform X3 [Rhinolophus ferrumequinum]|uniref:follistatin-related protein 3 isoform X3 n=1 Tax=Rhinolophus ferrumequinum TaxID=59479 RepID=UPI00140FC825|nr:follistatin-related protein 3 isoform X3 [Rhinolophus ferrumequinum]